MKKKLIPLIASILLIAIGITACNQNTKKQSSSTNDPTLA